MTTKIQLIFLTAIEKELANRLRRAHLQARASVIHVAFSSSLFSCLEAIKGRVKNSVREGQQGSVESTF